MTSMSHLVAVAGATDDSAAELANLRAAYQSACTELIEVRRQRDEAIAHGEELLARLVAVEESSAGVEAAIAAIPAADAIQVAPVQAVAEQASPIPTIVEPAAPQVTRWLPPAEDGDGSSFAHEFAALKELSPDAVDETLPAAEPMSSPMNVLPTASVEPKQSIWRRKIQVR
jgi:hypothetical protein